MGHAHGQALLEAAVLALVSVLLLDLAVPLALFIFQLEADGSPEETLWGGSGKSSRDWSASPQP